MTPDPLALALGDLLTALAAGGVVVLVIVLLAFGLNALLTLRRL